MGFTEAVKTCFSKYATFSGRAPRAEYWWFWLFLILLALVAGALDYFIFGPQTLDSDNGGPIAIITNLATLLPSLAVTVRRLHDTNKPWYYILMPFAAGIAAFLIGGAIGAGWLIGIIVIAAVLLFLYWMIKASDPGANNWGPNPYDQPFDEEVFS